MFNKKPRYLVRFSELCETLEANKFSPEIIMLLNKATSHYSLFAHCVKTKAFAAALTHLDNSHEYLALAGPELIKLYNFTLLVKKQYEQFLHKKIITNPEEI